MNVNKVMLVGRLTRDVEVRNTTTGSTVANVSIATNRFWNDQSGQKQEQTEFHNVVLFGKLAELAGQYLVKGQELFVEGRLQTRSYTGKDNIERRTTEIVAENMQFGSKPQGGGSYQQNTQQATPQARTSSQFQATPQQQAPAPIPQPPVEEEIPTINLDDEQGEVRVEDVPF
ncbi:MAG: single-stranded DNA-binding protein [Candidatus Moranbacteria bacterium]|nr:single-stranded DNA-binding protein [Candidatus Moranbacteria bacterium]